MKACKHCGGDVANGAVNCPHCGGKLRLRNRDQIALLFVGFCVLIMYGCISTMSDIAKEDQERVIAITERNAANEQMAEQIAIIVKQDEEAKAQAIEDKRKEAEDAEKAKRHQVDVNAFEFLKKRVEQGSVSGAYRLALKYLNGDGTDTNRVEAIRLLTLAADEGDKKAKAKLEELAE